MEGGEPVHVGRIDVGASPYQSVDLVSVGGGASGQEHAPVCELDSARLVLGLARLQESVGLLPSLQLLGPLEQGRGGPSLQRHFVSKTLSCHSHLPSTVSHVQITPTPDKKKGRKNVTSAFGLHLWHHSLPALTDGLNRAQV